ncbi:DUF4190 domain-containing protein [Actinomycetospora termitidis]|uniref:DUF4190 domain-containing protein n=1 Tax=Actinomycetospora termitidis TaxID=3053470 RepID=A0ABT7MEL9_9PSEU|nr:DUF4190 domain-containing protein [Actinomycetospora sp. Odt1-22]MDL5159108.1 DUF4190 domain-containing protein [Actinomycetospora sp. Odt1-22]
MTQQLPPYASPEQPAPGYTPAPPAPQRTNTMAILSIVFAFVFSPLGIVFGVIGRRQARERNENGRGLATAGMWLSIVFVVLGVVTAVIVSVMAASIAQQVSQLPDVPPASPSSSSSSDIPAVTPEQLAPEVSAQIGAEDVVCPEMLPGQVGATTVCTGTVDGEQAQLGVTVTEVSGTQVAFRIARVG